MTYIELTTVYDSKTKQD